jgi:hypothetical protein
MRPRCVDDDGRSQLAELLHCSTLSTGIARRPITHSGMAASDPIPDLQHDDELRVLDTWARRHHGAEAAGDRAALVAAVLRAVVRSGGALVRMASAAAAYASTRAASGLTLAELVGDLDELESALLSVLAKAGDPGIDGAPAGPRPAAHRVHDCCSAARRVAVAAYGRTIAMRERSRVRNARHDIVNAIGAVRNSMILIDDEPTGKERERLHSIARRNSRRSETLVRTCLADESVLTGAVGWAAVELAGADEPRDESQADRPSMAVMDIAAALAMQHVLELVGGRRREAGASARHGVMRSSKPMTTASAASIRIEPAADSPLWQTDALAACTELATALGARIEADAADGSIRLVLPLVAGHSSDDLGRSSEGHDSDAVGF